MNRDNIDGFVVRHLAVQELEELDSFVVGLSDSKDGSGDALIFATGLTFDEQDRSLGQDTYSISTASGATAYDGVIRCVLDDNVLTLDLDPKTASTLGVSQTCQFPLEIGPSSIARLKEGLRQVLMSGSSTPKDLRL
ncbi:MAG: hypothetical protein JWO59_2199 [Chloroflexi bacterium]|nr:hypothetical protein [Chloroflexota bacterium]